MENLERVCANCGTANEITRTRCTRCGTRLVQPLAPRGERSLLAPGGLDARSLAVGAGVLLARAGWAVFRRVVLPRAWHVVSETVAASRNRSSALVPTGKKAEAPAAAPVASDEADVVVKSWRVWAVKKGRTQYTGTETVEWRIKQK